MYSIKSNIHNEIIIKNSRFICYLYKIKDKSEVNDIIDNIKRLNKDATHYCYAYIIDDYRKSSDDGEPSGTAGIPMLKVLEANELNNILAVVVRYFGGILLGAGGLVRAYTKSVTNCLTKDNIVELTKGYNLNIDFDYNRIKEIDYLLKDININNKSFINTVIYNIDIPISFLEVIKINNIDYELLKEINIEK